MQDGTDGTLWSLSELPKTTQTRTTARATAICKWTVRETQDIRSKNNDLMRSTANITKELRTENLHEEIRIPTTGQLLFNHAGG